MRAHAMPLAVVEVCSHMDHDCEEAIGDVCVRAVVRGVREFEFKREDNTVHELLEPGSGRGRGEGSRYVSVRVCVCGRGGGQRCCRSHNGLPVHGQISTAGQMVHLPSCSMKMKRLRLMHSTGGSSFNRMRFCVQAHTQTGGTEGSSVWKWGSLAVQQHQAHSCTAFVLVQPCTVGLKLCAHLCFAHASHLCLLQAATCVAEELFVRMECFCGAEGLETAGQAGVLIYF
jgi:hypothetical protein